MCACLCRISLSSRPEDSDWILFIVRSIEKQRNCVINKKANSLTKTTNRVKARGKPGKSGTGKFEKWRRSEEEEKLNCTVWKMYWIATIEPTESEWPPTVGMFKLAESVLSRCYWPNILVGFDLKRPQSSSGPFESSGFRVWWQSTWFP